MEKAILIAEYKNTDDFSRPVFKFKGLWKGNKVIEIRVLNGADCGDLIGHCQYLLNILIEEVQSEIMYVIMERIKSVHDIQPTNSFIVTEMLMPVAMQLSCSDPAGYGPEERWWAFGNECYGYSGETYMGQNPEDVIRKFKIGEEEYDNRKNKKMPIL